jgi:hypothetical protein
MDGYSAYGEYSGTSITSSQTRYGRSICVDPIALVE